MTKAIGPQVFVPDFGGVKTDPVYKRVSAKDLNLSESWFRDAINANPDLVIAPCRQAGLVPRDEQWQAWATEFSLDAGQMDVLLLSSLGRVGIVETKLSYNPEGRREVVAQILDYALALQDAGVTALPRWPTGGMVPDEADVRECIGRGEFLLVITGDAIDPRALRLGAAILAGHLTSEWNLAMVDLNLYAAAGPHEPKHLLIPELRGVLVHEARQVVRVVFKGEKPEVSVEVGPATPSRSPTAWNEERFFEQAGQLPSAQAVEGLRRALAYGKAAGPGTRVDWGSGVQLGSFAVRAGKGTLFYSWSDGTIQLYVKPVTKMLGDEIAAQLFTDLAKSLDTAVPIDQAYPSIKAALLADDTRFERFKQWAERLRRLLVKDASS